MKIIFLLPVVLLSFYFTNGQNNIRSNKKNIKVIINGKITGWSISPEVSPDRLKVYCTNEQNEVIFQTGIDSARFRITKNDTIRFSIILNSKDTARTEIIGIRDLPDEISATDKLYWLGQIWSEIKYNFVNIDKLNFDLDSLYKSYIPMVQATKNDYEYYQVLKRFVASLHDGHSEVSDNGQFYPYTDYIPVSLQDFGQKIYITAVRKVPGFDSAWVGAELTEIEGIPTLQYLETRIFPFISASTSQHLWMQGIYRLQSGLKEQPFTGTIRKTDGKTTKIVIQRNGEATRTDNDQYWGPEYPYPSETVSLEWLGGNIALLHFNRFYPEEEAISELDRVAPELLKAKGLIIDLRKNGGGSTEVAWRLQMYLTKCRYFLNYAWETRTNDGVHKANGNWQDEYRDYYLNKAYRFGKADTVFIPDTLKRINCPTVVLIGRYTFSAAEDFLVNIFEVPGRPTLIGEETGGSTGSPLVVSGLPGDGYARICTRRICYPNSEKRFVNSGVKPDIVVKQTIEDYLNKKDVVLERAIKELEKSNGKTN